MEERYIPFQEGESEGQVDGLFLSPSAAWRLALLEAEMLLCLLGYCNLIFHLQSTQRTKLKTNKKEKNVYFIASSGKI